MDARYELNGDLFIWDTAKAASNLAKHGVRFERLYTHHFRAPRGISGGTPLC